MAKWARPGGEENLDLSGLDAEQYAAVTAPTSGAILVAAGPGAGKTRTLTHRAGYLISQGVAPNRIALVTFTKKATTEMVRRLATLTPRAGEVAVSTIHSLGYRMLRDALPGWGVLQSPQVHLRGLLEPKSPMYPNAIGISHHNYNLGAVALAVALYKDHLDQADAWLREQDATFYEDMGLTPTQLLRLVKLYEEELEARHQIDFEDMYVKLWRMWQSDPGLAERHARAFDHVLVDEYQDTSYGQLVVLGHLAGPNLYAVGDVDQSIYAFRGAEPDCMLSFKDYYPDAKVYHVATNYRSTRHIVSHTQALISYASARIDLPLRAHRADEGSVTFLAPVDEVDEAQDVVGWIAHRHAEGVPYGEIAVLARTGAYPAHVEIALLMDQVPYKVLGGTSFFGREPVMDLIAYLQVAADPTAREAFLRIVNVPKRYLGNAYRERLTAALDKNPHGNVLSVAESVADKPHERGAVASLSRVFEALLAPCPGADADKVVRRVRQETGYDGWFLRTHGSDEDTKTVEWLDILEDLATGQTVSEMLDLSARMQQAAASEDADAVTLCTAHRAKGLEWQAVAVIGAVYGLLPHARGHPEEERRIAYVAFTRAKDHLLVTSPESVRGRPRDVSPYILEAELEG